MRILLSNDDGIHAAGIRPLYEELKKLGTVWVVAPLEERSTTGHSLTMHKPLRMISLEPHFYGVSGSPADCVYLGIRYAMRAMPDLVVSGINRGANLGQDVYYSGTVSAAREACMLGIPSMAVSLSVDLMKAMPEESLHYRSAARVAVKILQNLKKVEIPEHTFLNVNVPNRAFDRIKGIQVTRQGFRYYCGNVVRRKDQRGKDYYWVGGRYRGYRKEQDSDCGAVESGYASLTPMKLDATDLQFLAALSSESALRPGRGKGRR